MTIRKLNFWIQNIRAMQQDTVEVELGMDAYENPDLYAQLRNEVEAMVYLKNDHHRLSFSTIHTI